MRYLPCASWKHLVAYLCSAHKYAAYTCTVWNGATHIANMGTVEYPRIHFSTLTAGRSRLHLLASEEKQKTGLYMQLRRAASTKLVTPAPLGTLHGGKHCHAITPQTCRVHHRQQPCIIVTARPSRTNWILGQSHMLLQGCRAPHPQLPPSLQLLERSAQELVHHVSHRLALLRSPGCNLHHTTAVATILPLL